MASIRGQYESMGVQRYYQEQGSAYSNPHFPTLKEVVPAMLDQLLGPLMPLDGQNGLLDLCCGAGEFTLIFQDWEQRHNLRNPGQASGERTAITGADPYTREGYTRATGREAEGWSFEDICDGVLEETEGVFYDVAAISYAIHLLEKSRYFSFFQALARRAHYMLIISPTKNKGLVEMSHGWEEVAYVTAQKVHTRFYKSLLFEGEEEQ